MWGKEKSLTWWRRIFSNSLSHSHHFGSKGRVGDQPKKKKSSFWIPAALFFPSPPPTLAVRDGPRPRSRHVVYKPCRGDDGSAETPPPPPRRLPDTAHGRRAATSCREPSAASREPAGLVRRTPRGASLQTDQQAPRS